MSSVEYKIRKLLQDATFFIKNAEEDETFISKCNECMNEAEKHILDCPRQSFFELSSEVIVMYIEVALLTGTRDDKASRVTDIFFQRVNQQDQHFCKALLAKASIEERKIKKLEIKGDENFKQVNLAFSFIKRALDIASKPENKLKYQFIIYNSSIRTWQIIRGLLRPGWSKLLVEIIEKISNMLEEMDDFDFNWRCRYLNILVKAMFDAEKKPEALKILDKLIDLTKKRGNCNFQETLFRNRIHYYRDNNAIQQAIKKEIETGQDPMALRQLIVIQQIKSGVIPENQVDKELQGVMTSISPLSLSSNLDDVQGSQVTKIQQILLDRLAECGRVAIKFGLIKLAEGCSNVINRANPSLRAQVWTLYTTAEILLKKPSSGIDQKTGMKLNTLQKQMEDMQKRCDALAIIERAMIANKKLADADIIIEGCYLIWNMSLPLLRQSKRSTTYRPFLSAAQMLEQIQANDNQLRVNFHLELAKYEIKQDFLSNAIKQLKKCLDIDYSLTMKAVQVDITEDDDIGNFQRPQDKYIKFLLKKLDLKTNLYGGDPETVQDQIILDIENAKNTRDQKMRETLLDKALKALQDYEEIPYKVDPSKDLVEEEILAEKKQYHFRIIKERKQRVLISTEMAKLALEENIINIAFDSASLAIKDKWDVVKDHDLIIAQSESHTILAKCYVEYLLEDDIEIGHKKLVTLDDDQDDREFTNDQKTKFHEQKIKFTHHIIQALKLGSQSHQTWLVFNASIEFMNNYLPIFKQSNFNEIILDEGVTALIESYECMNNCFENANFSAENIDYELSKKMNVFSNLAAILARIYEFMPKNDEAVKVCDTMLQKQLPSNLKKTFDSIKARITKQIYQPSGQGGSKAPPAGAKGAKDVPPPIEVSKSEQTASEILGYLELIKNGNKDLIQKALDSLQSWTPNEQDELELELNAELWCRLGRLSIDQSTNHFVKIALFCSEQAILRGDKKIKQKEFHLIPIYRLRWYSVSECLYGESLYKLVDSKKQEKESQDKLLHESISHFVESCNIAAKAGIGYILLETCKCMWNALLGILDAQNNRKLLIKPLCKVHQYLKDIKEDSDPDFLSLFYSALFLCIQEDKDWKLGERIVEEAFMFVPSTHQKVLWEAKMNFLSKLGKNVLTALSNMKESNASLMAKVYVKLARSSSQQIEQHSAYNKAIEILRKEENVEVVEVLIEYAEWMQRSKYSSQDVEDQLLLAVDILLDIEPGWDEEEDETNEDNEDRKTRKTGKSKSSKLNKQSVTKKSRAGKSVKKSQAGARSKVSNASKRSKSMKSMGSKASKKTKTSLAANQEEEGQPQFLNCQHYEKLIRIHSMLAMISHDSYKQREYTLDAHFFVLKIWEQTFQCFNAALFFEQHKQEIEELGYSQSDPEQRKEFFKEIILNNEISLPAVFALPEKAEDWVNFQIPQELISKIKVSEDKYMISKYAFMKPELTLFHLNNIYKLMEDHYFSIQQLPVIFLLQIFNQEVLSDSILAEVSIMKRSRLLMNLGLKQKAEQAISDLQKGAPGCYELTDDEKTFYFEKIKALRDINDDMKSSNIPFEKQEDTDPLILEQRRIHQSWIALAEEQIKWGNYIKAKDLLQEVNIHSRILKDKQVYAQSLQLLSTIKYLEGESGSALKMDMMSHKYASTVEFVEKCICHTFDLLSQFNKIDDCKMLIDSSLGMLQEKKNSQRDQQLKEETGNQKRKNSVNIYQQNNLTLEFAISKCYILRATLSIQEASNFEKIDAQESYVQTSFDFIDKFEQQLQVFGCNLQHIVRLIEYAKLLQNQINQNKRLITLKSVETVNLKYERLLKLLLKIHENLTEQMYFIGIHQDSSKSLISLPLTRIMGVVKLKIAQISTDIDILKQTFKQSYGNPFSNSQDELMKQDKVVASFMENINKQIEIQANNYNKELNKYEKNIAILNSSLNMIHKDCIEYSECLVEISKCKRLLAVEKKHLRQQWRQDAQLVDEISMNPSYIIQGKDRSDTLMEKQLDGEILDSNLDYKEEALISFVGILENNKVVETESDKQATEVVAGKGGKDAAPDQNEQKQKIPKSLQLTQMLDVIGKNRLENVLATFSVEFAELRGNLNKEQAFYNLANYQYAMSRQYLQAIYESATTEKHPDVQRQRQQNQMAQDFCQFTSPCFPKAYQLNKKAIQEQSKPIQIMQQFYHLEEIKETLPHSGAYLIMQLSDDESILYCGCMFINKDRKIQYFIQKMDLPFEQREALFKMISNLAQTKLTMLKSPITIEEDLNNLEKDSIKEIDHLIEQMENFFQAITQKLDTIINPKQDSSSDENQQAAGAKGGKAADPKKDDKKAPAKAPPAKGGKGNPADAQLVLYESGLPLTSSGIESLVLFLDSKIQSLPFESLKIFDKVPVVARDFNLHLHLQRLKSLGHQAELHNNRGIQKENLSYIVDPPTSLDTKAQNFVKTELPKMLAGSTWKGIYTLKEHQPSLGEWQAQISKNSLFLYFSMTCLLHKFPPSFISELSIFSQCKAMIIFDRMNSFKNLVDRSVITSRHFVPSEQPMQEAALFSLCGVNSILTNHWSTKPENSLDQFEKLMKGCLVDGLYLGASLKHYWDSYALQMNSVDESDTGKKDFRQKTRSIYRYNSCLYGVPIVRIV